MGGIANFGDKRMTLKEVANATGAAYSTVAAYAQKAGWTRNGKMTLLTEEQVTVIVEAMKARGGQGQNITLQDNLEGINTAKSRAIRIGMLARQQHSIDLQIQAEMEAEISELRTENTRLANNLQATKNLLAERETGLSTIQRIAEAGGLMLSDRDDLASAYRGRR